MAPDSPDPIVATVSENEEAILVSSDGDFRAIAPRIPDGQKKRFRKLSRITLKCNPAQAAQRISAAMSLIESEYEIAQNSHDPRMMIIVSNSYIRTDR
jgi:predicted nuclease of predicted toxin-antitoxin system